MKAFADDHSQLACDSQIVCHMPTLQKLARKAHLFPATCLQKNPTYCRKSWMSLSEMQSGEPQSSQIFNHTGEQQPQQYTCKRNKHITVAADKHK